MAYEQKNTDISVFKNEKREKDTHPHWKGTALIDGQKYEVAFWEKGDKGTMLAGQIKPARERELVQGQPSNFDAPSPEPFSDDIPF